MSERGAAPVVLMLSLLMGLQPITTDLYLPALPALRASFSASMAQTQLTLSGLLLAFGLSQLLWGPVSDRFGRRPVLLIGLCAYTLAAVGSALATSVDALVVWRILQGAAMGACVTAARATLRDLYEPEIGARVLAKALGGLGLLACISAPLGGWLAQTWGWRSALAVVAIFGAVTLAIIVLRHQETLTQPNLAALQPRVVIITWAAIAGNGVFRANCLLATASYGALITFLASSSFVFTQVLGWSSWDYGWALCAVSFAYILGTLLCRRLLPRLGVVRTVRIGGALALVGAGTMFALAHAGVHSAWAVLVPWFVCMIGHGVNQPCAQAGVSGPFPHAAGAATALSGFVTMLAAFFMGAWLGENLNGTVFPMVNAIACWACAVALIAWGLIPRAARHAAAIAALSASPVRAGAQP